MSGLKIHIINHTNFAFQLTFLLKNSFWGDGLDLLIEWVMHFVIASYQGIPIYNSHFLLMISEWNQLQMIVLHMISRWCSYLWKNIKFLKWLHQRLNTAVSKALVATQDFDLYQCEMTISEKDNCHQGSFEILFELRQNCQEEIHWNVVHLCTENMTRMIIQLATEVIFYWLDQIYKCSCKKYVFQNILQTKYPKLRWTGMCGPIWVHISLDDLCLSLKWDGYRKRLHNYSLLFKYSFLTNNKSWQLIPWNDGTNTWVTYMIFVSWER